MSNKKEIRVLVDVHCIWQDQHPRYRAYVNDEMFTERTWIWQDAYLEEALTIVAPVGRYLIRYELVDPHSAMLKLNNWRVDHGLAHLDGGILDIL